MGGDGGGSNGRGLAVTKESSDQWETLLRYHWLHPHW